MASINFETPSTRARASFAALSRPVPEALRGHKPVTYTEFLDESPMSPFLWLIVIGVCVAQLLDGFDFQATAFALPGIAKEFGLNPTQLGAIGSLTNIGLMCGALVFAPLSDRFGRKPVFQWVLFTYAFGTALSAIAWDYNSLLVARFIAGMGIGAEFPVAFALLAEFSPKRMRHIFVAVGPMFYSVGWFVCAVVSTFVIPAFGWRAIYWLGVTPALGIIYVRFYLPESVRFLLQRGRVEEAGKVTKMIAQRAGYGHLELVPPVTSAVVAKPRLWDQISSLRLMLVSILVLGFFFFANSIQNTGFSIWLPSIFVQQGFTVTKSFTFMMVILAVTPFGQLFAMWLQDRIPRKWAMLLLAAGSALCFFGFGLGLENKWPIWFPVVCNALYQGLSQGIPVILYTLGAELFPTRVRSLGMGVVTVINKIGSIIGPFTVGLLMTFGTAVHQIIYYFTIPLVLAAVLAIIFIRIDTRQKGLEEVNT